MKGSFSIKKVRKKGLGTFQNNHSQFKGSKNYVKKYKPKGSSKVNKR